VASRTSRRWQTSWETLSHNLITRAAVPSPQHAGYLHVLFILVLMFVLFYNGSPARWANYCSVSPPFHFQLFCTLTYSWKLKYDDSDLLFTRSSLVRTFRDVVSVQEVGTDKSIGYLLHKHGSRQVAILAVKHGITVA